MRKIILLGYMGSGKSTLARMLSAHLQLPWLDLDRLIEAKMQQSIQDIFEQNGEIYFRKIEHQVFKDLMSTPDSFVLSLGGGTPCYGNNYEFLQGAQVVSFYLQASPKILAERIQSQKSQLRPLLRGKSPEELEAFIGPHVFERSFFYQKATHTLFTDHKTPEQVLEKMLELLG